MKVLISYLVRLRNPNFELDKTVTSTELLQFLWVQIWSALRGLKVLIYLKNPKGLLLGSSVKFFSIAKIKWGRFLRLGDHVYVSALGRNGIVFGDHVSIGAFSRVIVSTTFNEIGEGIAIGNHVGIGEFAYLGGAGGLEIGDHCIVGQYLSCHPENHQFQNLETPIRLQGVNRKGIRIGKNCWIGSKVTILDGVEIGDGCIIAAGSVVNKSFPPNVIIGGVPAKILKSRTHEVNHLSDVLCR